MVIFWVFTVCGGFTRSMVIFQKLFSQCNIKELDVQKHYQRREIQLYAPKAMRIDVLYAYYMKKNSFRKLADYERSKFT